MRGCARLSILTPWWRNWASKVARNHYHRAGQGGSGVVRSWYNRSSPVIAGGPIHVAGENPLVKIVLRERESAQEAVRRLRKILDRSGLKRELRRRERYEKPSAVKRREKMSAIRRSKARSEGG